jgi:hypothetical protein
MGVRLSIRFVNDTPRSGDVGVFRDAPTPGSPAMAWLVVPVPGHATRDLSWEEGSDRQAGYWIAFGQFVPGEVIDTGAAFAPPVEVVFPPGVSAVTATLTPNDTWLIDTTR